MGDPTRSGEGGVAGHPGHVRIPEQPQALSHVQSPAGAETGGRTQQGSRNPALDTQRWPKPKAARAGAMLPPNPSPKAGTLRTSPSCCPWKSFLKNKTNQAGTPRRGQARGPEHPPCVQGGGSRAQGLGHLFRLRTVPAAVPFAPPLPSSPLHATRWAERGQS